MHILVIPSWYKTPTNPLQGSFFEEQARALMHAGAKVGILVPIIDLRFRRFFGNTNKTLSDFDDGGIPTYYFYRSSIVPRSRRINYLYFCESSVSLYREYVSKNGRPDIIHAHGVFSAGILARYLSKKFRVPYVITEHYSGLVRGAVGEYSFNRKIVKRVYNDADASIVVSSSFAENLKIKYGPFKKPFVIIPNMVDDLFFERSSSLEGGGHFKPKFTIITNSFLTPIKNHSLLLESFRLLLQWLPNSELVIGGDGYLKEELEMHAVRLGLKDSVSFLGALSRREVKEYLDRSDLFVCTSLYETFGVAVAEALARGKPVVSTDCGGPAEIVEGGDGILVGSQNAADFAAAVASVLNNLESYDKKDIVERCIRRFGSHTIISKIMSVYSDVLLKYEGE